MVKNKKNKEEIVQGRWWNIKKNIKKSISANMIEYMTGKLIPRDIF